jgi:hypothetical protein
MAMASVMPPMPAPTMAMDIGRLLADIMAKCYQFKPWKKFECWSGFSHFSLWVYPAVKLPHSARLRGLSLPSLPGIMQVTPA